MNLLSRRTSLVAAAAAAASSALAYPFLPEKVATHFDANGNADGFSTPLKAALQLPAFMLLMHLVNDRMGAWPGQRDRLPTESGTRARDESLAVAELGMLAGHLDMLLNALGVHLDRDRVQRTIFGAMFIGIGNLLPRLPRNGLIGIRTPWTLADPTVWERTHRVGGYLVTSTGVITLATVPFTGKWISKLPVELALTSVAASAIYSFAVRHHPDFDPGH